MPASGPAIIAANHLSFFDSVALLMAVRRPISFVGKSEYMHSWKTRHLLPAMGMIPVDRTSGFQALDALEVAAGVLRADGIFVIYPEGTRSRDGKLHAGHTGVGQLAAATGRTRDPDGHHRHRRHPTPRRSAAPPLPAVARAVRPADRRLGRTAAHLVTSAGASPTTSWPPSATSPARPGPARRRPEAAG